MREITIVGGGLAGLSLGCALRNAGVPVTLHERFSYPKHRVCGEFISGVSETVLESLRIANHFAKAVSIPQVSWFIEDKKVLQTKLSRPAFGISRFQLDQLLAEDFVKKQGQLIEKSTYREPDAPATVWADGKAHNRGGSWIALSIHLKNTSVDHLEMHSGPSGYIGLSPIENGKTNVTGLFKKNQVVKGKGLELIKNYLTSNQLESLAGRIDTWETVDDSFCAISGFEFGSALRKDRLSLGDAQRLIPPFVGNGMSMALESSAIAAPILTSFAKDEISWESCKEQVQQQCAKLFKTRMSIAAHFHPVLLSKWGLKTISLSSQLRLFPVNTLFHLTR